MIKGVSIINHQQVGAYLIAQSVAETLAARVLLYQAARNIDPSIRSDLYADIAKLIVTQNGVNVADRSLQVLAGFGYCGHKVERLLRDARLPTIGGGTNKVLRNNILKRIIREYRK